MYLARKTVVLRLYIEDNNILHSASTTILIALHVIRHEKKKSNTTRENKLIIIENLLKNSKN
jgi:hypothetical protein